MPRRTWDANTKVMIVLQGLQGRPVAEMGTEPQMSQSQSDQGRDQCLAHATNAVADPQRSRKEARVEQKHTRLKPCVGELTCE
jgi:hypothetical protein